MSDYDFTQISDYDLERVVRDLLQAELQVTLESFTRGKDKGIDLRYANAHDQEIIVQCKHYARTGYPGLLRSLKAEVTKVQALSPRRYILATSVGLTPPNKDEIVELFTPFIKSTGDVYGRDDLNNLLTKHPNVERRNLKLWLTSTAVLERVLNASLFNETASELEHIKQRMRLYVENPSLHRAIKILEQDHFCIISGVPGIGKTTLAEMLLIYYLDKGFEVFRIWDDVGEARKVFDGNRRQIFYYDDFLGRTGIKQPMQRNEDERILRFMNDCKRSNARFVLTTREYILNQARSSYEALEHAQAKLELASCIVNLTDYTPLIRAQILYNHLYFSDLPADYLEAVTHNRAYMSILSHRNFSPRIIERMTDFLNLGETTADSFVPTFVANLDNPRRIWEKAYYEHISESSQNLLLVLVSLPNQVKLNDLQTGFENFNSHRSMRLGRAISAYDFRKSLRELDGNFIRNEASRSILVFEFHNPSIRDFLEAHLLEYPADVADLLESTSFFEQADSIWQIHERARVSVTPALRLRVLEQMERLLETPSAQLGRFMDHQGSLYWSTIYWSILQRFLRATSVIRDTDPYPFVDVFNRLCAKVVRHVGTALPRWSELASVLSTVLEDQVPGQNQAGGFFATLKEVFITQLVAGNLDVGDFWSVLQFCDEYEDLFRPEELAAVRDEFRDFVKAELEAIEDASDPSEMEDRINELEALAGERGIDISEEAERIRSEAQNAMDEPDDPDFESGSTFVSRQMSESEIHSMFDGLRTADRNLYGS